MTVVYNKIMADIQASLKREEGVRKFAYKDSLGLLTIGVGRCIEEGHGLGISEEEADILLKNDIERSLNECRSSFHQFWGDLTPSRQRAMIEMCFQLGLPKLKKFSKALAGMAAADYETAADEFLDSRWATQTPARAKRMAALIREG